MTSKLSNFLTRRSFFASSGAAALTLGSAAHARVAPGTNSDFVYEVQRTEEEWLSMLTDEEFVIMREGFTEKPKTGTMWEETREGTYSCKGCDLHLYNSQHKVVLDKGWVFFYHSQPDAVMTNIDGKPAEYGGQMSDGSELLIEVHCRRCGSHQGHLVFIKGNITHCINSQALTFNPTTA